MRRLLLLLFGMLALLWLENSRADSLWERRDPRTSQLFMDRRARNVGDLLTIAITEHTIFDGKDDRTLKKDTGHHLTWNLLADYKAGSNTERKFTGVYDSNINSHRELDGQADFKSDRLFTDNVTVRVIAVMPNGNLIVEGYRRRIVQDEARLLVITGIVRPIDINNLNVVQSQFVGNLSISYRGKGADTSYSTNGWLGKILNVVWPF